MVGQSRQTARTSNQRRFERMERYAGTEDDRPLCNRDGPGHRRRTIAGAGLPAAGLRTGGLPGAEDPGLPRRPAGPGRRRTAGDKRQLHRFGPLSRGGHPHPPRGAAERPLFQVARPAGGGNHRPVCPPLLPCKRPGGERPAAGGPLRVEPPGAGHAAGPPPRPDRRRGGRGTAPPERGHLLRQAGHGRKKLYPKRRFAAG